MATCPVESMQTGGLFWFVDLTMKDPYYALPLVTCGSGKKKIIILAAVKFSQFIPGFETHIGRLSLIPKIKLKRDKMCKISTEYNRSGENVTIVFTAVFTHNFFHG